MASRRFPRKRLVVYPVLANGRCIAWLKKGAPGEVAPMLQIAQIMSGDASTHRNSAAEPIALRDRDEIVRCLGIIRTHGQRLQRSLSAGSVSETELIASLEEIEHQTGRINQILIAN